MSSQKIHMGLSLRFAIIAGVAVLLLAYFAALSLIFPGYFEPIAIPHNDLYMPLAIANSPFNYSLPRPVGSLFDYLRGRFGLSGSIYFSLALVFANCVLSIGIVIWFVRRSREFAPSIFLMLFGVGLYGWAVFTHPFFYIFAAWDAYAQISYFFLALSVIWYFGFFDSRFIALVGAFFLMCLAFLAKETYLATFVFLAFVLSSSRARSLKAKGKGAIVRINSFSLPLMALGGFAIAFIVNAALKSPFTANSEIHEGAYRISLAPTSVLREWLRYARDGWNGWSIVAVVAPILTSLMLASLRHLLMPSIALVFAGMLAWLPNAALPNHHFGLYSFSGAYLFFLPVVLVFSELSFLRPAFLGRRERLWVLLLGSILLILPAINSSIFARGEVEFYRSQIERQRRLVGVVAKIAKSAPKGGVAKRVLLTGIAPPYNPFDYPAAFASTELSGRSVSLDVVGYGAMGRNTIQFNSGLLSIRRINVAEIDLSKYDEIFGVALSGDLVDGPWNGASQASALPEGVEGRDIALYPEMARIFSNGRPFGEVEYLRCGIAFRQYEEFSKSISCLNRGLEMAPGNPYLFFNAALTYERMGRIGDAIRSLKIAAEFPGSAEQRKLFLGELRRLEKISLP